ncbi:MAG: hypothetical protein CVU50_06800 [Candidatus Cloacimonetes bacterium HGW-Cloacimonetes-3]|jgi:hypothetical protein|nr:MAG: hypothetical protein CVU50_06800 [Candidatus Cloacimonetes bacterium HGW-Cloacimonetes-3]
MLTIDWKERLDMDTEDYLKNKLTKGDYDFEIIFNAYPERVNGKIPTDVINHVAGVIVHKLGKTHEQYVPFYQKLWVKKGEYGKIAFSLIMSKLLHKKPQIYLPLFEDALAHADNTEVASLLDKVMLPLLRKHPEKYLSIAYAYSNSKNEFIHKNGLNLLVKLLKKREDLIPTIMEHFSHQWSYPLGEAMPSHVLMLKAVAKQSPDYYLKVWEEHGSSRDPQIVELLCAAVTDYIPQIEAPVELWTHSGNARVKKAATAAYKLLLKKKGA